MTVAHFLIAGTLIASPVAAIADPAQPAPITVSATKPAKDPNALICKSIEQLGSRIQSQRICTTAAQWKEYEYRAGQWADRMSSTRFLFGGN